MVRVYEKCCKAVYMVFNACSGFLKVQRLTLHDVKWSNSVEFLLWIPNSVEGETA
jgi:hypothetical protein